MTQIIKTSADASPFNKPGDWTDAGHTVELVGCGGSGAAGTRGTGGVGGAGAGGGAYVKLTFSSGAIGATTPYQILGTNTNVTSGARDSNGTIWEGTTNVNSYWIQSGSAGNGTTAGVQG